MRPGESDPSAPPAGRRSRRTARHRSVVEAFMVAHGGLVARSARTLALFGSLGLLAIGVPAGVAALGPVGAVPPVLATAGALAWFELLVRATGRRIREQRLCLRCAYPLREARLDVDGAGACPECGAPFTLDAYA